MKKLFTLFLCIATTFVLRAQIWMPPTANNPDPISRIGQTTIGNLGNLIGAQFEISNNSGSIINQFIYNASAGARLLRLKGGFPNNTQSLFQVEANTWGINNLLEDNIRFKVQANGLVGVNSPTPHAFMHVSGVNTGSGVTKLFLVSDVNGNDEFSVDLNGYAWARKLTVTLNTFPDYVFAKNYNLMPLTDVEKYIIANKHLPNIKSADEYTTDKGVDIGELQTKLLEKVEELTLYVIQQQKQIDEFKQHLQV